MRMLCSSILKTNPMGNITIRFQHLATRTPRLV